MGVSRPSLDNILSLSRIFHATTDYLLGNDNHDSILIEDYTVEEKELLMRLIRYMEGQHEINEKFKKWEAAIRSLSFSYYFRSKLIIHDY